jgi:hypothetical protein
VQKEKDNALMRGSWSFVETSSSLVASSSLPDDACVW